MLACDFHALYPWQKNDGKLPFAEMLFTFDLPVTRAEIWPFVMDTSRFNRALGLGKRIEREENGVLLVQEKMHFIQLEWVEHPWTWLSESHAVMERSYSRGPFQEFRAVFHVVDNPEGGVTLWVQFAWTLKSRILAFGLRKVIAGSLRDKIGKLFSKISDTIQNGRNQPEKNPYLVCTPITNVEISRRLDGIANALLAENLDRTVVQTLVNYVKCGDELDLYRLRPLKLAREWKLDDQELLRACLHATRVGLLNLSWDITCPHCRGVREETGSLSGIPKKGHCDVCDIDFSSAGENAVEVTFHVHESIRKTEKISFCAAEPAKKAHIKWQQMLEPGEKASAILQLTSGKYRLREVVTKHKCLVDISRGAAPALTWETAQDIETPFLLDTGCAITVKNTTPQKTTYVLEELWWERDILRPGRLFCVPEFQKLFSRDALASGVQLNLGNQTIFFSDIVGSTKFYQEVGDSAAFAAVVEHFDELTTILIRNGGTIIKTIGDAVMAAFHTPEHALKASEEAQLAFCGAGSRHTVRLRISVHFGPVIAVNWNTGKDYFGHVVNFAAKMQSCAEAGEVAISEELMAQLRSTTLLKSYNTSITDLKVDGRTDPARVLVCKISSGTPLRRVA